MIPESAPPQLVREVAERLALDRARNVDRNPLTGLPGNITIREELRRRVLEGGHVAAYIDIRSFKPFNDRYGFARGDAVIRLLAATLVSELGDPVTRGPGFVGHIGGDDFVAIGQGPAFRKAVSRSAMLFAARASSLCDRADSRRGFIESTGRDGGFVTVPLPSVSCCFVTGHGCSSVEGLAARAASAKKRQRGEMPGRDAFEVFEMGGEILLQALLSPPPGKMQDAKAVIEAAGATGDRRMIPVLSRILASACSARLARAQRSPSAGSGHRNPARCCSRRCRMPARTYGPDHSTLSRCQAYLLRSARCRL